MRGLVFTDTSALVALFVPTDQYHDAARAEIRRLLREDRRLLTTNYVFDETVTRVKSLAGHDESCEVGERILNSAVIRRIFVQEDLEAEAWRLYRKLRDQAMSFTDVKSVAAMKRYGLSEIFTFDQDFRKAGYIPLPRRR